MKLFAFIAAGLLAVTGTIAAAPAEAQRHGYQERGWDRGDRGGWDGRRGWDRGRDWNRGRHWDRGRRWDRRRHWDRRHYGWDRGRHWNRRDYGWNRRYR